MRIQHLVCRAVVSLGLVAAAHAAADGLRVRWQPGLVLNYEFEGHFGFVPQQVSEAQENLRYRGPAACDYYFSTLIELRILEATPGKGFAGSVAYLQPRLTQWQCPDLDHQKAEDRLRMTAAANPIAFSVNARGEITFPPAVEEQLDFRGTFRLLTSSTTDLLHTILASRPMAPGEEWKPDDSFVYWKDYIDTGFEISASTVKYVRDLEVARDQCTLLKFRYIFSPEDTTATASTPQGKVRVDYAGAVSTGSLQIATLFDRTTGHIAWVHRSREINNRIYLGHEADGTTNTLTRFHLIEESIVRQLRKDAPLEWSAGLKSFENVDAVSSPPSGAGESGPLIRAALEARSRRHLDEGETPQMVPPGYVRYEKRLCPSTWSCSVVSVAMPGSVRLDDDTPERTTFLVTTGTATASVNIGPDQQKIVRGLSDQEELRKNVLAFLANKLWLRAGPGRAGNISETYVQDYPALLTDFSASRGDGLRMEGRLASVLTAWGEIITIGCAFTQSDARTQEEVCRQVLASVRVRQITPQ